MEILEIRVGCGSPSTDKLHLKYLSTTGVHGLRAGSSAVSVWHHDSAGWLEQLTIKGHSFAVSPPRSLTTPNTPRQPSMTLLPVLENLSERIQTIDNPQSPPMPTPESEAFLAKKPKVPPTFDGVDLDNNKAVAQAADAVIREQWVQVMMGRLVREELNKCYRREGVNHLEKCGRLRGQ